MTELDKEGLEAARKALHKAVQDETCVDIAEITIRAYLAVADVHGHYCATEGCGRQATVWFERGGVGSHYCRKCYMRIQALPSTPKEG